MRTGLSPFKRAGHISDEKRKIIGRTKKEVYLKFCK
jgi:hypothetical protein